MAENLFGQEQWARRGEMAPGSSIGMSELPIGAPVPWPAATAPGGWLICDGAAVPANCPVLTSLYGANLPNLKGRVIVGFDAAQTEFDALGETGGAKTHTLTSGEMANHQHTWGGINGAVMVDSTGGDGSANRYTVAVGVSGGPTWGTSHTGSDGAHNNLQPYRVFNYIVKAA